MEYVPWLLMQIALTPLRFVLGVLYITAFYIIMTVVCFGIGIVVWIMLIGDPDVPLWIPILLPVVAFAGYALTDYADGTEWGNPGVCIGTTCALVFSGVFVLVLNHRFRFIPEYTLEALK